MKKRMGLVLSMLIFSLLGVNGVFADISFEGAIEFDYKYTEPEEGDSTSDIELSTAELIAEGEVNKNITGTVVLDGTDGGSNFVLDEGYLTISDVLIPNVYMQVGLYTLPFGQYFSHTIADPLSDTDSNDITDTAATIGYSDENMMNLNLSLTAFTNDERTDSNLNTIVVACSVAPVEGVTMGAAYMGGESETTDDRVNAYVEVEMANITADVEYIGVIDTNDAEEEMAISVGFALQANDKLELACRYDSLADAGGSTNDEMAILGAANYEVSENTTLMCEYRFYDDDTDNTVSEVTFRIATTF